MLKRRFYLTVQAKGGSGKSMLIYLYALKNEYNSRAYFIDLDSSVKSSLQQLKFIQGKKPARFALMNLCDDRNRIDRQLLFEKFQEQSLTDYDEYFFDMGAPESDQFPSLFSDYTIEEFKQVEDEINVTFIFNVVVAGGGAYEACTTYLKKLSDLIRGSFEINIYVNQNTFTNHALLIDDLKAFAAKRKTEITSIKFFGDFDNTTSPHKNILRYIQDGRGMEAYKFIEKIKILKELSKI